MARPGSFQPAGLRPATKHTGEGGAVLNREQIVGRVAAIMPFQEAVEYHSKRPVTGNAEGGYDAYSVPQARPRRATLQDEKSGPATIAQAKKVFELYSTVLDAAAGAAAPLVPKKDDYLVDSAGQPWRVLHVEAALNGGVFNCFVIERDGS
jgi:hypothetical protein